MKISPLGTPCFFPLNDRRLPVFAYSGLHRSRYIAADINLNIVEISLRKFAEVFFIFILRIETVWVENSLTGRATTSRDSNEIDVSKLTAVVKWAALWCPKSKRIPT